VESQDILTASSAVAWAAGVLGTQNRRWGPPHPPTNWTREKADGVLASAYGKSKVNESIGGLGEIVALQVFLATRGWNGAEADAIRKS